MLPSILEQDNITAGSHLYSVMSMLSLAGLVVSCGTITYYVSTLLGEAYLRPFLFLLQAFVIAFSLGLGAIPWVIMSEVCSCFLYCIELLIH